MFCRSCCFIVRRIQFQKERVAEERQVKIDEQIEAETIAEKAASQNTQEKIVENGLESDAPSSHPPTQTIVDGVDAMTLNGASGGALSMELIEKIKSERPSFQCHSRNVSAASAFSACSLVSQNSHSDRDWREIAADEIDAPDAANDTDDVASSGAQSSAAVTTTATIIEKNKVQA